MTIKPANAQYLRIHPMVSAGLVEGWLLAGLPSAWGWKRANGYIAWSADAG